jgi:hypothetical protein
MRKTQSGNAGLLPPARQLRTFKQRFVISGEDDAWILPSTSCPTWHHRHKTDGNRTGVLLVSREFLSS